MFENVLSIVFCSKALCILLYYHDDDMARVECDPTPRESASFLLCCTCLYFVLTTVEFVLSLPQYYDGTPPGDCEGAVDPIPAACLESAYSVNGISLLTVSYVFFGMSLALLLWLMLELCGNFHQSTTLMYIFYFPMFCAHIVFVGLGFNIYASGLSGSFVTEFAPGDEQTICVLFIASSIVGIVLYGWGMYNCFWLSLLEKRQLHDAYRRRIVTNTQFDMVLDTRTRKVDV
jgi:hypothetical protein